MRETNAQQTVPLEKDETSRVSAPSFVLPKGAVHHSEITIEEQRAEEMVLPIDALDAVKRRVLIAYHAYGPASKAKISAFVGLPIKQIDALLDSPEVQRFLASGAIPCWTGAELLARVCAEAETAARPQDRLAALKLAMEYRSMTAPEGGSRSFKRIAAKFQMPASGGEKCP